MDLRAGTNNNIVLSFHDSTSWTNYQEFNPTMTSAWTTFSTQVSAFPNGALTMNIGQLGPGSAFTLSTGTFDMRYFKIYAAGGGVSTTSTISANTLITGDITSSGAIQCVSLVQTSDSSIKQNIVDADLDKIQSVFDAVQVKTYQRKDLPEQQRIGFVANDIVDALTGTEFDNIAYRTYDASAGVVPIWGLDYARLGSTVLWGVCKKQQARLDQLEARLAAYTGEES